MSRTILSASLAFVALCLIAGWGVFRLSYHANLDALQETGRIRVEQATDRLSGQMAAFSVLVNQLARHPDVHDCLRQGVGNRRVEELLINARLTYGAAEVAVVADDGRVLAHAGPTWPTVLNGPLLQAALNGQLGRDHAILNGERVFRFSRGVVTDTARPAGVVVVSADIAALEFEWGVDPEAIGFFDTNDVVVAANRAGILLRQDRPSPRGFPPFPPHSNLTEGDHLLWRFDPSEWLPRTALIVTRDAPQFGMTARGFLDVTPARNAAWIQTMLALALFGLAGLTALILTLRRRRLADRLAIEAEANARLEARVAARSAELKATQDQLVQASKLTALGQMSAGISHELNQPLAAIMTFAENGVKFLDRDRPEDARGNLDQIAGQVTRADRIIRNLRGFARSEEETVEPVDLIAAIDAACALIQSALEDSAAEIQRIGPVAPVMVMGGRVRLQQVIVNLMSNALDAMAGAEVRRITLTVSVTADNAVLNVRDTGSGVAEAERVFEPFYTTKELGASKGLGLGLSISYGIIGAFGGTLTCRNGAEGGAIFTITLKRAEAS